MSEQTPEASYRVERLPRDPEPGTYPRAYLIDAKGVMRRASEAEVWLWDELQRTRANLDAALEMGRSQPASRRSRHEQKD